MGLCRKSSPILCPNTASIYNSVAKVDFSQPKSAEQKRQLSCCMKHGPRKPEACVCCPWASGPCRGRSEGMCIALGDHLRFGFHMYTWLEGIVGEKHRELARIPAVLLQEAEEVDPVLTAAPGSSGRFQHHRPSPWEAWLG